MKNKPLNIEYKFTKLNFKEPLNDIQKEYIEQGQVYEYLWRHDLKKGSNCWNYSGTISLEGIKKILTKKQYHDFVKGKRNYFIIQQTKEQAKQRMIRANKGEITYRRVDYLNCGNF